MTKHHVNCSVLIPGLGHSKTIGPQTCSYGWITQDLPIDYQTYVNIVLINIVTLLGVQNAFGMCSQQ